MLTRRQFVRLGAAVGAGMVLPVGMTERVMAFTLGNQGIPQDPTTLQKFVSTLPIPGAMPQFSKNYFKVSAYQFESLVHPSMKPTTVWGYRPTGYKWGTAPEATWLGPSFVIKRKTRTKVEWQNRLTINEHGAVHLISHPLPVDPSIMWADPFHDSPAPGFVYPVTGQPPVTAYNYELPAVPLIVHVHGGEQPSGADGFYDAWWTAQTAAHPIVTGPAYNEIGDIAGVSWDANPSGKHNVFPYYNGQNPATIWYHDHALGLDRLNVYMGLAGAYVIYDPALEPKGLPSVLDGTHDRWGQPFDIPLVIQDRFFDTDSQLLYPAASDNPTVHPFWIAEFFGDTICVNGKAWPKLNVEPRKYRFRLLNGSNARFYNLKLWDTKDNVPGPSFSVVATDGGYLYQPKKIDFKAGQTLLMGPGERYEVVCDFKMYRGHPLRLINDANAPYPDGDPVDPATTGQIMKFSVSGAKVTDPSKLPIVLNSSLSTFPSITDEIDVTRQLTLNEIEGPGGPLEVVLNYSALELPVTERPTLGMTEVWAIVNMTVDAHPIHHHLIQAQILGRQDYDAAAYLTAWTNAYGGTVPATPTGPPLPYEQPGTTLPDGSTLIGGNPDVRPFLQGSMQPPSPWEKGWKDTTRMMPGQVTYLLMRWKGQNNQAFPFDAARDPGYVWHCHILEHEESDMMRPLKPANPI